MSEPTYPHSSNPYRDNVIRISPNKDNGSDQYIANPYSDTCKDELPNYQELHEILKKELSNSITFEEAKSLGDGLLDIYSSLYFEQD